MLPEVLNHLNIYIFSKDKYGKFLFCNDRFAEAAGLDSWHQIIGKTDEHLIWRHQAHVFQAGDHAAMQGKTFINVQEVMHQQDKVADILVSKHQLLNKNNECIGVIGSFIDISHYQVLRKSGYYDPVTKRFCLGPVFNNEFLTNQEYRVFKQILLGYTARQIASNLHLSPRTVEAYSQHIKVKMQCHTKGEIIELATKMGLNHILL